MPIVGSFAGASARAYGLGAGARALDGFYQIATTTVGASAVGNIEFTGIPAIYKHLQIRGLDYSAVGADILLRFNTDAGSNYSYHMIRGSGGSPSSASGSNPTTFCWLGIDWTSVSTEMESRVVDILDYADTNKFKTTRCFHTSGNNTSTEWLEFTSGNWRSTSAITSLNIIASGATFKQYSTFALYGITG